MREIKFRVWDREMELLLEVGVLDFDEWLIRTSISGGVVGERHSFKNEETDRFVLMQFTSLKDKNGKGDELYAGDILKSGSPLGSFESGYPGRNIGVIVWDDHKAAWCLEWKDGRGSKMRPLLSDMILRYNLKIGNIYDNPDLLEAK